MTETEFVEILEGYHKDIEPEKMRYLQLARERGFGEFDQEKLKIEKRKV